MLDAALTSCEEEVAKRASPPVVAAGLERGASVSERHADDGLGAAQRRRIEVPMDGAKNLAVIGRVLATRN